MEPPLKVPNMPTLSALKKKIAALQAQVERVTKAEMSGAIAKIRSIMDDYGVTIEHLMDGALHRGAPAKKGAASKTSAAKAPKATKGARPAKYQDPKSGATWSGLGRIPAWIAKARSRDAFLIDKSGVPEEASAAPAKKAASKKVATKASAAVAPAKKAKSTKKTASAQSTGTKTATPAKRAASKKAAVKASRKGVSSRKSAAPAQEAAVAESAAAAS